MQQAFPHVPRSSCEHREKVSPPPSDEAALSSPADVDAVDRTRGVRPRAESRATAPRRELSCFEWRAASTARGLSATASAARPQRHEPVRSREGGSHIGAAPRRTPIRPGRHASCEISPRRNLTTTGFGFLSIYFSACTVCTV